MEGVDDILDAAGLDLETRQRLALDRSVYGTAYVELDRGSITFKRVDPEKMGHGPKPTCVHYDEIELS